MRHPCSLPSWAATGATTCALACASCAASPLIAISPWCTWCPMARWPWRPTTARHGCAKAPSPRNWPSACAWPWRSIPRRAPARRRLTSASRSMPARHGSSPTPPTVASPRWVAPCSAFAPTMHRCRAGCCAMCSAWPMVPPGPCRMATALAARCAVPMAARSPARSISATSSTRWRGIASRSRCAPSARAIRRGAAFRPRCMPQR
jgi:hypothetical protein